MSALAIFVIGFTSAFIDLFVNVCVASKKTKVPDSSGKVTVCSIVALLNKV
ncbi:hypothetical protein ES702_02793 [subsurface metagenome]